MKMINSSHLNTPSIRVIFYVITALFMIKKKGVILCKKYNKSRRIFLKFYFDRNATPPGLIKKKTVIEINQKI